VAQVIVFTNENGGTSLVSVASGVDIASYKESLNEPTAIIVDRSSLPTDEEFFNSWEINDSNLVSVNMVKAKSIAHNIRKMKREEEFKPYDDLISKRIPGTDFDNVEAERIKIRAKYEIMQNDIDNALNTAELKSILDQ